MKDVIIIIPTYNEKENISQLLKEIDKLSDDAQKIGYNISVLIVDDNSPDDTAKLVEKFSSNKIDIQIIKRREKLGLGLAYIDGMKKALDMSADVIVQMDADLSHPSNAIIKMLERIENGNDFVIGSRYIKNGHIKGWGITRKIISSGANFLARTIRGIAIKDCTSGYHAIRADIIRKIDFDKINCKGYYFQIDILQKAIEKGAKVVEIPIIFVDRKKGKSKIRIKDIVEFFFSLFRK